MCRILVEVTSIVDGRVHLQHLQQQFVDFAHLRYLLACCSSFLCVACDTVVDDERLRLLSFAVFVRLRRLTFLAEISVYFVIMYSDPLRTNDTGLSIDCVKHEAVIDRTVAQAMLHAINCSWQQRRPLYCSDINLNSSMDAASYCEMTVQLASD